MKVLGFSSFLLKYRVRKYPFAVLVSGVITKVFQKVVNPYKENRFEWSSSNEKDDRKKAVVDLSKAMSSEPLHQDLVGENITVDVSARGPWGGGFCNSRGRTRSR